MHRLAPCWRRCCAGRLQQPPEPPPGGPGPAAAGRPGRDRSRFGPGSQQDLAATAGDRVFFAYDQTDITPEAQQILERQAEWLRRYPNVSVTIEGHSTSAAPANTTWRSASAARRR